MQHDKAQYDEFRFSEQDILSLCIEVVCKELNCEPGRVKVSNGPARKGYPVSLAVKQLEETKND